VATDGSLLSSGIAAGSAPVKILTREQFDESGKLTLGDFLQALPEQGNAPNFQENNGGINYAADGSTRINLRSLGVPRTLVLVDGHRTVPVGLGASPSTDLNVVPAVLVDRVEVIKDGGSALYGSDAIAGVVNVVTRRGFRGTEATAKYGVSSRGDAGTIEADVIGGFGDDRGGLVVAASYFRQQESWMRDRPWSAQALDYDFTTGQVIPSLSSRIPQGAIRIPQDWFGPPGQPAAACLSNPLCQGLVSTYGWDPGKRYVRDPSAPLGWRPFATSDFYNFASENYLTTPATRAQVYLSGERAFGSARAHFDASYVHRDSEQNAAPMPLNPADYGLAVSAASLYNPFGVDLSDVGRRLVEFGHRTYREQLDTINATLGIGGTLLEPSGARGGWDWDIGANYGRSSGDFITRGSFRNSLVASAVGPSMIVAGAPACVSTPGDASTVIPGCVPIDLLHGPGSIGAASIGYLGFVGDSRAFDSLLSLTARLSGELYRLPTGGRAQATVGYEFRRLEGHQFADPVMAAGDSADFNFKSTDGAYTAREFRVALELPLLENRPAVKVAALDLAGEFAQYDTFGSNLSYRLGFRYQPFPRITLRGAVSTAFRAPSIRELFTGATLADPAATDPCASLTFAPPALAAQCAATGVPAAGSGDFGLQELARTGGNPHVKAERSKSYTTGLVFQPSQASGFVVSLDYYRIRVDDAIRPIGAENILAGCYPLDGSTPNAAECALIQRDPATGRITVINDVNQNAGSLSTEGFDFSLRTDWGTPVGRLGLRLDVNWVDYFDQTEPFGTGTAVIHGASTFDLGAMPRLKALGSVVWRGEHWGTAISARFVRGLDECSNPFDPTTALSGSCSLANGGTNPLSRSVGSNTVADVQASYSPARGGRNNVGMTVGINNVFDRAPPRVYSASLANSDPGLYDFLGRYFYARLRVSF
jgi:outer membrane receptor protein involved in Fe transport